MLVFDIETKVDEELIRAIHNKSADEYKAEMKIKKGHDFLTPPYHKIVSLGVTEISNHDYYIKSVKSITVGLPKAGQIFTEQDIINKFDELLKKTNYDTLVSYNGKGFDIPVIMRRAMKYGLSLPNLFYQASQYKSYLHKFNDDMHLDLMQVIPERISLQESCMTCGFTAKNGMDGSMVENADLKTIDEYVKRDTLVETKYLYYWLLLKGTIDIGQFNLLIIQDKLKDL